MSSNWVPHPTILKGEAVELVPLELHHYPALLDAAADPRIWEFYPGNWGAKERFEKIYNGTLALRDRGLEYPFVIRHTASGSIIGSTRLMDIAAYDRRLEIGGTWLIPAHWGTAINFDCKLALLTFSFESLQAHRVQLKTQHNNIRSRKAIEKIGGIYEGVLREHILKDDGSYRSSAYFSILEQEWPDAKVNLQRKLSEILNREKI